MNRSTAGLPVHCQLPVYPLSRWCHPTISSSVIPFSSSRQSFPASGSFQMSQLFTSDSQYWSFTFNISPSSEYSGLIFFRMDWLDLLAVQGTLKSLLQHQSSKASIGLTLKSKFHFWDSRGNLNIDSIGDIIELMLIFISVIMLLCSTGGRGLPL